MLLFLFVLVFVLLLLLLQLFLLLLLQLMLLLFQYAHALNDLFIGPVPHALVGAVGGRRLCRLPLHYFGLVLLHRYKVLKAFFDFRQLGFHVFLQRIQLGPQHEILFLQLNDAQLVFLFFVRDRMVRVLVLDQVLVRVLVCNLFPRFCLAGFVPERAQRGAAAEGYVALAQIRAGARSKAAAKKIMRVPKHDGGLGFHHYHGVIRVAAVVVPAVNADRCAFPHVNPLLV